MIDDDGDRIIKDENWAMYLAEKTGIEYQRATGYGYVTVYQCGCEEDVENASRDCPESSEWEFCDEHESEIEE